MKKIMAVLMSLAVLFAFAACDSQVSVVPLYGKQVLSVTATEVPVYFYGETLNPADVTLRVVYDDNTEATFTGAQLGMTKVNGTNNYTVTYGTDKDGKVQNWTIKNVAPTSITKIVINTANAATTVAKGQNISTEGLTYTAYYAGGARDISQDLAFEAAKLNVVKEKPFKYSDSAEEGDVVTVELNQTAATSVSYEISPEWKVTVTEAPKATDFAVDMAENAEVFTVKDNETALWEVPVVLTYTDENGDEQSVTFAAFPSKPAVDTRIVNGWTLTFVDHSAAYKFSSSSTTITVNVSNDSLDVDQTLELKVTSMNDYPVKVDAAINKTCKAGTEIKINDFTFTVKEWASGSKVESTYTNKTDFELDEEGAYIPEGTTGETYDIDNLTVTFKNAEDYAQKINVTVSGTITLQK